jgi:5'-nucleotidase / UDP-sugar diphosphatase
MKTKRFTILHSNDMHGDFLAEVGKGDGKLIGGLALLSGYINKVRAEEENVLFVIAGDMVQGSLIDSEYKGISTMEIMNYLAPDVVALGNHEFDYGLPHLLFLEKMANFPIVNANLYVKKYNRRLMRPYIVLKKAGMEILFTGIITEKVMDSLSMDRLVGSFVSLEEASAEVGKICDVYKNSDIDLTIVLTHIGIESDIALAKMLKPEWGVDMIIGGHSHSLLEKPEQVNNILIAQAGTGTNQIGRFDITIDDDTNSVVDWKWKAIAIDESIAKPDRKLSEYIQSFKSEVDRKYNTVVTKFTKTLTHPCREMETELGDIFADAFAARATCDVMFVGSGSIRIPALGPVVTLQDVMSCFPFDDSLIKYEITGLQLKTIFSHIMRKENRNSEGECYQVNSGVQATYDDGKKSLTSLSVAGKPVVDVNSYTICVQGYHSNNSLNNLSMGAESLTKLGGTTVVTTSAREVLIEYLRTNQNLKQSVEGRLSYIAPAN